MHKVQQEYYEYIAKILCINHIIYMYKKVYTPKKIPESTIQWDATYNIISKSPEWATELQGPILHIYTPQNLTN
jgi:hypothetical protein